MKLRCFASLAVLLTMLCTHAQIIDTSDYKISYLVDVDTSTYNMSGATAIIGADNNHTDTVSGMVPIGFHFYYMGRQYDSVSLNEYGFLALGTRATQLFNNYLSNDTMNYPILAPYWTNVFFGIDGGVLVKSFGTAPQRAFVVQWNVVVPAGGGGTYLGIIQLTLHENNNRISYKYLNRPGYSTGGLPQPADQMFPGESTGIKDFVNGHSEYIKSIFNSFFWSSYSNYNVNGNLTNNVNLTAGGTVLFYGDSSASNPPINFSCTPAPTQVILNFTDNSNAEDIFKIYRSTDAVNFTELRTIRSTSKYTTATLYTFTDTFGVQFGTTYYYRITASALGGSPSSYLSGTAVAAPPLLSGIKTIPGDYPSITAAMHDIYHKYLAGPITLEVQQNYDTTYETFPIIIDSRMYNSSAVNTLTIRPAANVTTPVQVITLASISRNVWQTYGGANYLTINGAPGGVGNSKMLQTGQLFLADTAYNIQITNTYVGGIASYYNGLRNLTVKHCAFNGSAITLAATSYDVTIDSNDFYNTNGTAINVQSSAACYHLNISYNNFYKLYGNASGGGVISIFDTTATSTFNIDSNFIGGNAPGATGYFLSPAGYTGISVRLRNTSYVNILGNTLRNVAVSGPFNGYTAIYLVNGNPDIENNTIGDSTTVSINCGAITGIYCTTGQNLSSVVIRNNSVNGVMGTQFIGIQCTQVSNNTGLRRTIIQNNIIGNRNHWPSIHTTTYNTIGLQVVSSDPLLLTNNSITGLKTQLAFYGHSYGYSYGIRAAADIMRVADNQVYDVDALGISIGAYSFIASNVVVEHNSVKNYYSYGITVGVGPHALVNANTVYTPTDSAANAITVGGGLVTNNFICMGYDSSGAAWVDPNNAGIYAQAPYTSDIINNTIVTAGDSTPIPTIINYPNIGIRFDNVAYNEASTKNNLIEDLIPPKSRTDDAGVYDPETTVASSHDFFYSPFIPGYASTPDPDTAAILNTNPQLRHAYGTSEAIDLHLLNNSPAAGAVPADPRITTDIDGNFRPMSGNISAGAHELNPLNLVYENTPPVIAYTPLHDTTVVGSLSLSANISDATQVMGPYSSAPPVLYFSHKGTGNWLQSNGSLISGSLQNGQWLLGFTDAFLQGLNVGDTVQYFVAAQDEWGNLATNAAGGHGYNTVFIDTLPPVPDFFVFEGYIPVYTPTLRTSFPTCDTNLNVYVTDTANMNLTGNNVLCYYKINAGGTYNTLAASFTGGTQNSNIWSVPFNRYNLPGTHAGDTIYYFTVVQDNLIPNRLASSPAGATGPSIHALTTYPQPAFVIAPVVHYPVVDYTPYPNVDISTINTPQVFTFYVSDTTAINLYYANNGVGYFKRNYNGSYISSPAKYQSSIPFAYSTWSDTLRLNLLAGLRGGDTVYYFVAVQDENCYNALGSNPPGAAGSTVYNLNGYPSRPAYFVITGDSSLHCQPTASTISRSICAGDTLHIAGKAFTAAGNYTDTITNAGGCDSIIILTLTVHHLPVVSFNWDSMEARYSFFGQNTMPEFCMAYENNTLVAQFLLSGGEPSGGIFTGDSVSNDTLYMQGTFAQYIYGNFTYTYTDSNHCAASVKDTLIGYDCLGIDVINATGALNLYPNPATNELFIKTENMQPQTISIYDAEGRRILAQTYQPEIDIQQLNSGVYFVEVQSKEGVIRKRFVKM